MFIERNVFQLKFGMAREAIALWKEYLDKSHKADPLIHARLLTDLSGEGYTLVLELMYDDYAALEPSRCRLTNQADWAAFYQKFIPYCESTHRTLYKLQLAF